MNNTDHPLFRQYPLNGHAMLSTGPVPTPYHVYDGHGIFIGGTANLEAVRKLLLPEHVYPAMTTTGEALMGLWIFDFADASLGAHHELQFSIFVSEANARQVAMHRLALIEAMVTRPDIRMLCHGLWNNQPQVVAYNRELLALDARLSASSIERDARSIRFSASDHATGKPVLAGHVARIRHASWQANLALMGRLGMRRLRELAMQPWIRMPVVNPVGALLEENAIAQSFTRAEASALRYFDPQRDRLLFGDSRYSHLQFQPQFVQLMEGFKFVYLMPQTVPVPARSSEVTPA